MKHFTGPRSVLALTALTLLGFSNTALGYDGIGCDNNPSGYCRGQFQQAPVSVAPVNTAAVRISAELNSAGIARFTRADYKPGVVRHIVLFRYTPEVTAAQKAQVIRRFLALKTLCQRNGSPYIVSIETGSEISGEGADQNLEQGFVVTFKSQGDRNYYVGQPVVTDPQFYEPAHQAFKDFVGPLLDQNGALVFDLSLNQ